MTNQEMPTVDWPMPGFPFFPEDAAFAPGQDPLARHLSRALLLDLALELDRRREGLKSLPDPTPGQQEAGRQLTAAVAALYAADRALRQS